MSNQGQLPRLGSMSIRMSTSLVSEASQSNGQQLDTEHHPAKSMLYGTSSVDKTSNRSYTQTGSMSRSMGSHTTIPTNMSTTSLGGAAGAATTSHHSQRPSTTAVPFRTKFERIRGIGSDSAEAGQQPVRPSTSIPSSKPGAHEVRHTAASAPSSPLRKSHGGPHTSSPQQPQQHHHWASPRPSDSHKPHRAAHSSSRSPPPPSAQLMLPGGLEPPSIATRIAGAVADYNRYSSTFKQPPFSGGGHVKQEGVFVDLLEATRKSFAAGMGDWDLQELDWCHPEFKQRMLQGPLGPETLKNKHSLMEPDILRLYRVLYLYSVGFCAAVLEPTERAEQREELLEAVFRTFPQLWDEALGIAFQSEMVEVLKHKTDAITSMHGMSTELDDTRAENLELKQRLNEFVRGNIDNMLAYRMLRDKVTTTEGEVVMLAQANDQLGIKLAGSEMKMEGIMLATLGAQQRMEVAVARAEELERQASDLKTSLSEQQGVLSCQYFQIRELEAALGTARQEAAQAVHEKSMAS